MKNKKIISKKLAKKLKIKKINKLAIKTLISFEEENKYYSVKISSYN